jgi:hypothetical protein
MTGSTWRKDCEDSDPFGVYCPTARHDGAVEHAIPE